MFIINLVWCSGSFGSDGPGRAGGVGGAAGFDPC
jgi:hypothetical protein